MSALPSHPMNTLKNKGIGALLIEPFACYWRNRDLTWQMTKREIEGRYRGSALGMLWAFLNPLLLLAVFTFIFSVIFQVRWNEAVSDTGSFSLVLFTGLICFWFFADCAQGAPTQIRGRVSYVKKVVFPLEVFAWVLVSVALFHTTISSLVLFVAHFFIIGLPPLTALLFPVMLLPLVIYMLGLVWFLSALGVFLQDIGQLIGILVTMFMFLTPIFYPVDRVPEEFRLVMEISPIAFTVGAARAVVLWGEQPNWQGWGLHMIGAFCVMFLGFAWFKLTRRGFADVL
ncbi:ABC transporter permease [Rhodovibrionaceae bacterium A322]